MYIEVEWVCASIFERRSRGWGGGGGKDGFTVFFLAYDMLLMAMAFGREESHQFCFIKQI